MGITWDLLFSYWLFAWFLIYYVFLHISGRGFVFTLIKKAMNPIMGLIIVTFENVATLLLLIYSNSNTLTLLKYSFSILLFKFLPIYLLSKHNCCVSIIDFENTLLISSLKCSSYGIVVVPNATAPV